VKYLLDSDHLSLLEHTTGSEYAQLVLNLNLHHAEGIGVSVSSFQEQVLGAHTKIQSARTDRELLRGFELMKDTFERYAQFPMLGFDQPALTIFKNHDKLRMKIGTMDLRIASIALANDLTLVTRNTSDFARVPNLKIDDWTK
jgi:tRNA(fMet)-specific endonuclease VapC